uniref:Uncharacterized protein n=1 Tax=Romanomermis culicivorax TaxID=13658 RepID=A0A915HN81_ROMCU
MAGVNIANLLIEAKNLASKLQEDDKSTDQLINQAQNVSEKISCLKEVLCKYKECLNDLHDGRTTGPNQQRPRSILVHNLQQENRQIKILQDENRQLKMALEEHQIAIDLIMKRYRQQVTELVQLNQCQQNAFQMVDFLKIKESFFDKYKKQTKSHKMEKNSQIKRKFVTEKFMK